jgi:ketosteroid isomerase-like protein
MSDQTTLSPTDVLGLLHDAFNAGDMDRVAGFTEVGAVDHGADDGTVPGSAEHLAAWDRRRRAFRGRISDFDVKVERSIEHRDTVGQLLLARGTIDGKPLEASGIHIVRVRGGKIVEHWAAFEGRTDRVRSPRPTEILRQATESFLAGFPEGGPGLVAPDAVDHTYPEDSVGEWEGRRRALRARMSGVTVGVERTVESGDTVGQLIATRGTLDGRPFQFGGFHLVRVREGKIVEHWAVAEPFA